MASYQINLTPINKGQGRITVYSKNECGQSLPVFLDIEIANCKPLFIPNIFSSSSNMGWNIEGMDSYPKATIKVYNRWGSLVYESNGYENPWNGNTQNGIVSLGTYYYVVEFHYMNKKPITGSVTILK